MGTLLSSFAIEFRGVTCGLAEPIPGPDGGKDSLALTAVSSGMTVGNFLGGLCRVDMITAKGVRNRVVIVTTLSRRVST